MLLVPMHVEQEANFMSQPRGEGQRPGGSQRRNRHVAAWIGGGLAAAGVVIAALIGLLGRSATVNVNIGNSSSPASSASSLTQPRRSPLAHAAFTSPHNYATNVPAACELKASGTAQHIQRGHHLWLFLYFYDDRYYAGDDLHLVKGGGWYGHIYIGGAKTPGQQFVLWLFDLGPNGWTVLNTDINGQQNGFNGWRLANDVTRLAYVTFITGHERCQTPPAA
jgi:hypothetical protein